MSGISLVSSASVSDVPCAASWSGVSWMASWSVFS